MIEELTLRNFKSYKTLQTIRFTPGVNKISGRNASGKTTILEAVIFGLFGDLPGVDKKDLLPITGGGDLYVEIVLRTPKGLRVRVHREATLTKKGSEEAFKTTHFLMEVEGDKDTITRERDAQDRLRELLGISSGTFFNVVYARQKEFVDILNPEKGRMNAILGLTTPGEIREQLREVKKNLEKRGDLSLKPAFEERIKNANDNINDITKQLDEISTRIKKLLSDLQIKRKEQSEAKSKIERAESISKKFRELNKSRNEYETNLLLTESKENEFKGLLDELGDSPEEKQKELINRSESAKATEERLRKLSDEELEVKRKSFAATVDRLNHQIREHSDLRNRGLTKCPKCGQSIDPLTIENELARWSEELEDSKRNLFAIEKQIKDVRSQAKIANDRRIEIEKSLDRFLGLRSRADETNRQIIILSQKGQQLKAKIDAEINSALELVRQEYGPIKSFEEGEEKVEKITKDMRDQEKLITREVADREARFQEAERSNKDLTSRLGNFEKVLSESRERLERIIEYESKIRNLDRIVERYVEYEKDLRENTLRLLEYKTFEYFRRLTDQQLYSGCIIDRERYTLEVQPKGSPKPLPAWRSGGGHESLFALAERLALLKVRNFPYLLILDEPTDAVDSENVPHLLEYIARSSREIGQVLLVTHHGQGEEEGVNLIRVRKVNDESRVFQEGAMNI